MTIRLQTAKGTDIPNLQFSEVSAYERNWNASLPDKFPEVVFRTGVSAKYNCHGLTFASRRTRIPDPPSIAVILNDDQYVLIEEHARVKSGDVVIYYGNDGDPTHSGVVLENVPPVLLMDQPPVYNPLILSKWGSAGEAIHHLRDVPLVYGDNHQFYRCEL